MHTRVAHLINTKGKGYHEAVNDILLICLLLEKYERFQEINEGFIKYMLGEELYCINLSASEYAEITEKLKLLFADGGAYSRIAANVLACSKVKETQLFLYQAIKGQFRNNRDIIHTVLTGIPAKVFRKDKNFLQDLKDESINDDLDYFLVQYFKMHRNKCRRKDDSKTQPRSH